MNESSLNDKDGVLWRHLVESHRAFAMASQEFLAQGVNRVKLIRSALRSKDRITAIYMLNCLPVPEIEQIFDELIFQASFSHGAIDTIRKAILSLPRAWVVANIRAVAEPLLQSGTGDEYRRLLELYIELDHELACELATRAANQSDPDIQEAGEDFLQILGQTPK